MGNSCSELRKSRRKWYAVLKDSAKLVRSALPLHMHMHRIGRRKKHASQLAT